MQLKWGFNWIGLVIFLLPMVINVFYVLFPPKNAPEDAPKGNQLLEVIEKASRMLYLAAMAALVSDSRGASQPLVGAGGGVSGPLPRGMDSLFRRRPGRGAAGQILLRRAHAPGRLPGAVLSVRRTVAAQSAGGGADADLRRCPQRRFLSVVSEISLHGGYL